MTDITGRIKFVMEQQQLSPAAFAEKLNIQRSGISHILNGRNKPSLDFVLKVLEAFPEIEAHWLLTGEQKNPGSNDGRDASTPPTGTIKAPSETQHKAAVQATPPEKSVPSTQPGTTREVSRIVLFYTDSTFESFYPHK